MPMKITSDLDWTNAIAIISDKARAKKRSAFILTSITLVNSRVYRRGDGNFV